MEIKISCCRDCPFLGYEHIYEMGSVYTCNHPNTTITTDELFTPSETPKWCAFRANKTLMLAFEEK